MGYKYAIIGAGRQGTASGYDLVKYGMADEVLFIDADKKAAAGAAEKSNKLTGCNVCAPVRTNVEDKEALAGILSETDAVISAVPYYYNLELTEIALRTGSNFVDLGGNTDVVKKQLSLDKEAKQSGITIIPDCGMDPGFNISIISHLLDWFDKADEIKSYGAGLLQEPEPPWEYAVSFHINGLTNEYYGKSLCVMDGKLTGADCFSEYEMLDFPEPLGKLEAAVTSGGLSTLPEDAEGKVGLLINKTLRYPGHWARFKAFSDLGLFDLEPVEVNGVKVIPRDLYHALLEPKIYKEFFKDLGILKIIGTGARDGKKMKADIEIIDYYDENTGLTSMQRLTGWHASVMAIMAAHDEIADGALPVHKAASGRKVIDEMKKRGISVKETYEELI